jgi:hypothetical protein
MFAIQFDFEGIPRSTCEQSRRAPLALANHLFLALRAFRRFPGLKFSPTRQKRPMLPFAAESPARVPHPLLGKAPLTSEQALASSAKRGNGLPVDLFRGTETYQLKRTQLRPH